MSFADTIGFKAVSVANSGLQKNKDAVSFELHYQLVHKSAEHEEKTNRALLPRTVNMYKDAEDGTDKMMLNKLSQELIAGFKKHFENRLVLFALEAIPSNGSNFIQLADLFIGSISRVLNRDNSAQRNHKDEFADFVLSTLELDVTGKTNSTKDHAYLCIL